MMRRSTGGNVMRAVGRVVGAGAAGVKDSLAATARRRAPPPAVSVAGSSPTYAGYSVGGVRQGSFAWFGDAEDWEAVGDGEEEEEEEEEEEGFQEPFGLSERFVLGQPPSAAEAEEAISTIQQIFVPVTFSQAMEDGYPRLDMDAVDRGMITAEPSFSTGSETDWTEPAVHLYSAQTFQSQERDNVLDAFRFLQVNPSVKRMVVSLSSDKAVWDAVMNNEVVQELKKSFDEAENNKLQNSEDQPDVATRILKWIVYNTKAKILDFFGMITKLVNELFNSQEKDRSTDSFDVALRSSFMLSVLVFIIVVVTRIQKS